jgi:hypothetical protein
MVTMFYLVGSRFYGTHRSDSDWDYLGEECIANRELCESMGLRLVPSPDTGGTHYWGYHQGRVYDILLVEDLANRIHARNEVAKLPNVASLTKAERHKKVREIINGLG